MSHGYLLVSFYWNTNNTGSLGITKKVNKKHFYYAIIIFN